MHHGRAFRLGGRGSELGVRPHSNDHKDQINTAFDAAPIRYLGINA